MWPVVAAAAVAWIAFGGGSQPAPLQGTALKATGIRLLVAGERPFLLDVDSGKIAPVPGLNPLDLGLVSVVGVAGTAGIIVGDPSGDAEMWVLRGRQTRVSELGTARDVMPAADGRSVWLKVSDGRGCALRRVRLDGRATRARTRVPCGWPIQPGGSLGVVARRTRLIDPATGRTIYRARWGVLAAAGRKLVLAGPGKSFTLVDVRTRSERRLRWPSILGFRDAAAVDPRGRFVALAFAAPTSSEQVLDVWLLDTRTGDLGQLPGFPAFLRLKFTSLQWTADGRLVLLGEDEGRAVVAVWRPGQKQLAVKRVRLLRRSGSDSFAVLR